MSPVPPSLELPAERLAVLDQLYWHSNRTASSLAVEFGLTTHRLGSVVTPLSAGRDCWWCRAPLFFRTRAERDQAARGVAGGPRCRCGAVQLRSTYRDDLVDTDAVILAPLYPPADRRRSWRYDTWGGRYDDDVPASIDASSELVVRGVDALARVGLRWRGEFVVVEHLTTPESLCTRLAELPTRVVVLPSLTQAMSNEGDSLALFWLLVAAGWRVISSAGSEPYDGGYRGWLDDLVLHAPVITPHRTLRLV